MTVTLVILGAALWVGSEWPKPGVHLIACDVGQGDAILIIDGFSQALIDAGPDETVLACLQKYLPFWDRQIELVVMTHPDQDHIGGFPAVLGRYQAKLLLMRDLGKKTQTFKKVIELVQQQRHGGASIKLPSQGDSFRVGEVELTVWHPLEKIEPESSIFRSGAGQIKPLRDKNYSKPTPEDMLWDKFLQKIENSEGKNSDSIVLFGQHNKVTWLLTGDLEKPGELALSQAGLLQPVNILKIGHHGAKTSTTRTFLQQLTPELAVISCGKNNRYGHPASEVVTNLKEMNIEIKRTDEEGHVHIQSDGKLWQVIKE